MINKNGEIILVITENNSLAADIMSTAGDEYNFIRANHIAEALSAITFNIPSLIICENNPEYINGFDFLKIIRSGIKTRLIPFIIVSSNSELKDRIKALDSGADSFIVYPFIHEEMSALIKSQLSKFKEFYLLSITDELTRLYNRREFIKKFNSEISNPKNKNISLSILDIDFFKKVNDLYGHLTGDKVLMKLADILKSHSSETFIPARFGGEEFVILMPQLVAGKAKIVMDEMLQQFSSIEFESQKMNFHVTFSAGIAEHPSMGSNVSELLARADQALYTAKEEGRNRVYTFSPIMSRNDKFWEYLKIKKGIYIDGNSNDLMTGLPYLPYLLEIVSSLDFEVKSIGSLVIKIDNIYNIEFINGIKNFKYDIENILRTIYKSCQLIFPSDTYIGLMEFFGLELIILFPSVVDFSFNINKFNDICKEIVLMINSQVKNFGIDISYSSDVLLFDNQNPRKIFYDINNIRKSKVQLLSKSKKFDEYIKVFSDLNKKTSIRDYIAIVNYYDTRTNQVTHHSFSLRDPFCDLDLFGVLIAKSIQTIDKLEILFDLLEKNFSSQLNQTLLIPWIATINFKDYLSLINKKFGSKEIILLINEVSLSEINEDLNEIFTGLPENISIGVDNCFIGNELLGQLSMHEFKTIILSENLTRNVHQFKERIKIISGLKIFLEQIGLHPMAKNITQEEEFHVISDLNITFASGSFIDNKMHT